MISPGTVAAIAASLMGADVGLLSRDDMAHRKSRFRQSQIAFFVPMAWDIATEAEAQAPQVSAEPKE